jgi:hypothetical protein
MTTALVALVVAAVVVGAAAAAWPLRRRVRKLVARPGAPRILVPFSGQLDPVVLDAAIRVAQSQGGVLVAAYLLVVPLQYPEDSARKEEISVAIPLLEAVEHAALRAGVPVDARIEKGRSATHALRRLWEVEHFDRIVAPAANGQNLGGFSIKELSWILDHAPAETIVLRPAPAQTAA